MEKKKNCLVIMMALCALAFTKSDVNAGDYEFKKPVQLKADGEIIDTGEYVAHSGPAFADLNDDGVVDLLVGNFRGNIEYFENTGSAEKPVYAKGKMLEADGETIKVHNW